MEKSMAIAMQPREQEVLDIQHVPALICTPFALISNGALTMKREPRILMRLVIILIKK